jgi:hypothetical protein
MGRIHPQDVKRILGTRAACGPLAERLGEANKAKHSGERPVAGCDPTQPSGVRAVVTGPTAVAVPPSIKDLDMTRFSFLKGHRGEYLVVLQFVLFFAFIFTPAWNPLATPALMDALAPCAGRR